MPACRRFHDLCVAGAPTEDAGQPLPNLLGRPEVGVQHVVSGRDQHGGCDGTPKFHGERDILHHTARRFKPPGGTLCNLHLPS